MNPPILYASTSMRITLVNRLLPSGHFDKRLVVCTLRAEHTGKREWIDDVRVRHRDAGAVKFGFGKCLGFFMDAEEKLHVAIQWYDIKSRNLVDAMTGMTKVEIMDSYDVVPAGSIRNGCLLMPLASPSAVGHPPQFWAIQSQREIDELRGTRVAS